MDFGIADLNEKTYIKMFERQAEKTPERIAVKCGEKSITYNELNQKANQLARRLRDEGVKRDSIVGIMAERSIEMVIAILAVFKSGGAYLPIEPDHPEERKVYYINDSKTEIILINGSGSFDDAGIKAKILDLQSSALFSGDTSNIDIATNPGDLAYVIYTSGSTGKPKGVMIEHAGMMNHIQAKINDLQINDKSIIAQNASHCFDISVWQFLTALLVGGKTIILSDKTILNLSAFINTIIEEQVTILEVVPSYLGVLIEHIEAKKLFLRDLKYLLATGETLKPRLVHLWYKLFPDITIVNAYGPTEASDDITHYFIKKEFNMERVPVGKPIQNMEIYIVDENMRPCRTGEKGEIWVSGIGVGRGYINNPDKTREVFINDPFRQGENIRLYKTGDIGAWLPDGNIEFFGRKDHQVKVNGFRIELGEIDAELLKHPHINESVTVVYEDIKGENHLCSYIVLKNETPVSAIKEHLSRKLPEYMIPSIIMRIDEMPLTENGKIDRKALPEPVPFSEVSESMEKSDHIEDITELKIREVVQKVLTNDTKIIPYDAQLGNYGIDSIGYIRIIVEIEKEFGFQFYDEDLDFTKYPDLRSIIAYVKSRISK